MFVYRDDDLKVTEQEAEVASRTELQCKWLMFQRMFNTRPARVNCVVLSSPDMQVMLNHLS